MEFQKGRPASLTVDPARGNRLKYHAAYAANPAFGEHEAQVVPLEQSYGRSRLLDRVERNLDGQLVALARMGGNESLVDDEGSGQFLDDLQASMNSAALTSYEGALTQATSPELRALMAQAAREGGPMAPIQGGPVEDYHARQISAAANPTHIPAGGHTEYMTDRYEDGTPGMGDEYPPDARDPHDHRPFVQHEGHRRVAQSETCRHCGRLIVNEGGVWIDPEAPATPEEGDDYIWREGCDANDSFNSVHEPASGATARRRPAERMAPGVRQQRPTFRPQVARQQPPVPPRQRPTVASLQAEASHLLEQAEIASSRGMHGKAALLERKADQIIARLEAASRQPQQHQPPRRPAHRTAGFMESTTEMPLDDDEVGSGFGGY